MVSLPDSGDTAVGGGFRPKQHRKRHGAEAGGIDASDICDNRLCQSTPGLVICGRRRRLRVPYRPPVRGLVISPSPGAASYAARCGSCRLSQPSAKEAEEAESNRVR
jgi:hypothetical protein